ncbi:MAG: hypothetical protein L0287_28910 [Anaerolineae bacterium]|nr:hypothetical protein [Anaerolineae bacterium]
MTCEEIAACIETDSGVQDALQQFISDNYYNSQQFTFGSPDWYSANETLLDGAAISGCDNDNLFGGITQMIDFINTRITDFMEQAELISNVAERVQLAIAGVPVVGALPVDEIVGFVDQVFEEIAENYAANFTADLRDQYRCDLFCLVKDTCELDFQTFADYFLGRVGTSIDTGETFGQAILWFTTGVFVGTGLVDAAFGLVCQALAYTSSVFGINIAGLALSLTAAMNDPDSDWMLLCEECGSCHEFDFTIDAQGWQAHVEGGVARATLTSVGWVHFDDTDPVRRAKIQIEITGFASTNITSVQIFADTAPTQGYVVRMNDVGGAIYNSGFFGVLEQAPMDVVGFTGTGIWLNVGNPDFTSYYGAITGIIVCFDGPDPFD